MSSTAREYDPEITDIADYVANKPIDSELAVSLPLLQRAMGMLPSGAPLLPRALTKIS